MAAPPAMSEEVASFWRSVGMPIPATVPSPLVLPPPPLLPGAANGLDAVAAAAAVVERGMGGGLTAAAVVSFELLSKDLLVLQNKDKKDVSSRKGCMCGKNDKNRLPKCTMVEGSKYSCKCPCFKFQQSCANCNCKGCMNPFGISKGNGPKRKIESSKAKAALTHLRPCAKKGSQFLKDEGEPSTSTRWNIDETILLLSLMEEFGGAGDNVNICKLFCKIARANTDSSLLIEEKSQRQVEGKLRNLKELQQIWYSQVYIAMEQPAASVASMDVHTSTENNI
eukprot:gene1469-1624_t